MPNVLIESQYFPSIAYFALMMDSSGLIIDQHENYHKGSYRNRTYIQSSQGPLALSVPLKGGKNSRTRITDVLVDNDENWQVKHERSIEACYGKSPYYEFYIHFFRPMFTCEYSSLWALNLELIEACKEALGLDMKIELSTEFFSVSNSNIDLKRDFISPKVKDQERLRNMFVFNEYDQVFLDELPFAPNLSILDLLFCLGPEARLYLAAIIK